MRITPNNAGLGARVEGIDLATPLTQPDFRTVLRALGQYGVLCFPGQDLDGGQLSDFGRRFGELEVNVANLFHEPGHPEMMILSNMKDADGQAGRPATMPARAGTPTCPIRTTSPWPMSLHAKAVPDARRQAAGRHAVPQHARRL